MISPELLRYYPLFGHMSSAALKTIAMNAEEEFVKEDVDILEEGSPADYFFVLIDGNIDLYYTLEKSFHPEQQKKIYVGTISPGEPFGISAFIEPFIYTSTVHTSSPCRVIRIEAQTLRDLCEADPEIGYRFIKHLARNAVDRLHSTRIQLAAAYAHEVTQADLPAGEALT